MNPGLTVMLTIVGLIIAAVPIYFFARSDARSRAAESEATIEKAEREARAPLLADNARLSAELAKALARITQLEDWLYGGRRRDQE